MLIRALLFCLLAVLSSARADVMISEFLADNVSGLADEDKDRSDWIELYNNGPSQVNLGGWYLTDDPAALTRWQLPATNLNANAYMVVFASGKNRATAGRQLHASFSLSAGGEFLALVKPDGVTIASQFSPEYPQQNPNVSYGLVAGSLTQKRFFATPTPGGVNSAGTSDFSDEVKFSVAGGMYTNSVLVTMSAQPGAVIRYTSNGTEPTTASTVYANPILFSSSVAVRAKAFAPGLIPSTTVTRTYVILNPELFNFSSNLPILVLSTFGAAPNESSPVAASAMLISTNGGRAELRGGRMDYNGRGTIKIRGSSSTQFPKKSYAFELQDELLQDRKASLLGMPKESDWVLYAPYTDKSLIRDFLAYEISNQIGTYAPRTRLIEVYVDANGGKLTQSDYVGVYVLIEKIKRDDNRVDIEQLLPSQSTQPEVTGGYIWKKDRLDPGDSGFSTTRAGSFAYVEPKEQEISSSQKTYLANYLRGFETALYAASFTNKAYEAFYSVKDGIDHHLMVELARNIDGYRLSTYISKDRLGKIKMGPIWDYNLTFGNADYADGWLTAGWYNSIVDDANYPWYRRLFQDPDFNQAYIDRWAEIRQKYIPTASVHRRVDELASVLKEAAARNYVKWPILGQYVWPNAPGYDQRKTYQSEIDWMKSWMNARFAWMDAQFLRAPVLSRPAGMVTAGTTLSITAGNPIYFTTDGSDPRLPGGAISTKAKRYTNGIPVTITNNTRVIARGKTANAWSAPTVATYVVEMPKLAITELMFNPGEESTNEFVELKNIGTKEIDLKGYRFSEGIDFVFSNSVTLAAGQIGVLVKDAAAFAARYGDGINVLGQFEGSLDNSGERIVLEGPARESILDFAFNNAWHRVTDGYGYSLVVQNDGASSDVLGTKEGWRASANPGGSPGTDDPAVTRPAVVISEVLANTDLPAVDAIELFNGGSSPLSIGGWFLTDDAGTAKKFRIPANTMLGVGEYVVFTEADFNADPQAATSFALSALGDEVFLFSADGDGNLTGYSDGFSYGPSAAGQSFGRYVSSDGKLNYPPQGATSLGTNNVGPTVGPVVINEIRYASGPGAAAFIELKNRTSAEVKLYDPARPGNRWEIGGLNFRFPENFSMPAKGLALVVAGDPVAFRNINGVPWEVPVFSFSGVLQTNGEFLRVNRPEAPDVDLNVPMVAMDEVRYNDQAPWPTDATVAGKSLERIDHSAYGNDPANWRAGTATPGDAAPAWNLWKVQYFEPQDLNNEAISGPGADPDRDGLTNYQEYFAGKDPLNNASDLSFLPNDGLPVRVAFEAEPYRSYTVYFRASLFSGAWAVSTNFPASDAARTLQLTNPRVGYYKLAIP